MTTKRTNRRACLHHAAFVSGLGLLLMAGNTQPAAAQAKPENAIATIPNANIGAKEFPDFDAVILQREQSWTWDADGTVRRRDHQWVKILDPRAIGAYADPRIDHCVGQDEMTIHLARTILPNGTVLPVPNYSYSKVGPDDIAGWPRYAGWTQTAVSFSGVENGCIVELDYEVVSKPGTFRWLEADLRLNEDYPTIKRIVTVSLPKGGTLLHQVDNLADAPAPKQQTGPNGEALFQWTFERLPGSPGEPQSLPWQKRCGRLRFTSCPSAEEWAKAYLALADKAAKPDESIKALAEKAVEKETVLTERVRKVAKKLADSFNFVITPKALHPMTCLDATEGLRSNYGNPLEAAAILAAALRSLGLTATLEVATDANAWDVKVPTESAFAGLLVRVDTPSGPLLVHPQQGIFKNPGNWGHHWTLGLDAAGKLRAEYIAARGEKQPSRLEISGKLTLAADGKASGDLRVRLTGGFYDPSNLETAGQQEGLVKNLVGRVLGDCEVTSHSIATLSDDVLVATAKVASKGELKAIGQGRMLRLGEGTAFAPEFPLPWARSYRKTDVLTNGVFEESVELNVELPKDWTTPALPPLVAKASGTWGEVERTVTFKDGLVNIRRAISVKADTLAAKDFDALRNALGNLRGKGANLLVVAPAEKPKEEAKAKSAETKTPG